MGNRIIKFRAWDGEKKEMITFPNYAIGFEHEENVIAFDYDKVGDYYEMELMQFTGFMDKNGKEIFEGDILKGCYANGHKAKVIFESGCFCIYSLRTDIISFDTFKQMAYSIKNSEIIGNIYETPNILENAGRQN